MADRDWLSPPIVEAPHPNNPDEHWKCRVSQDLLARNAMIARRTPIFQIWCHVVGQLPPINNIDMLLDGHEETWPTRTTLKDAVACFQGVKRPYDNEGDGASVLIYILAPKVSIKYQPDMACLASAVRLPKDTILTVQIRPADSGGALQPLEQDVDGIITRIEPVAGEGGGSTLPANHQHRYASLLWKQEP